MAEGVIPVYFRCNNGGWNKSHGQIEKTPRIDSFGAGVVEGGGTLFTYQDGKPIFIECCHHTEYRSETEREIAELYARDWSQTIELTRKSNGYGGDQAFFLCPACGERRRYLYLTGRIFLCRKCSRLNYRSQQETRSDSMYYYGKGMALVGKHLDTWPRVHPDGFTFCDWVPDRPRYMHETTYKRYLRRFLRYRQRYEERQLEDLRRILGPREWAKVLQIQNND